MSKGATQNNSIFNKVTLNFDKKPKNVKIYRVLCKITKRVSTSGINESPPIRKYYRYTYPTIKCKVQTFSSKFQELYYILLMEA